MASGKRFLADETSVFSEAHPRVAALDFEIKRSAFDHYKSLGNDPIRVTTDNVKARYSCPNDKCKNGGLDFDELIRNHSFGKETAVSIDNTYSCPGYEVKRTGRNNGRDCDNYFAVKGSITFNP